MRARALACACLVGVLLFTSGCGGNGGTDSGEMQEVSPSPQASLSSQLTTYTNEEWGFSLQHPADWTQGDPPISSSDFAIAFGNVARLGEMTEAEREDARAVWISVRRLPEPGSASDFRALFEGMAAEADEPPPTSDASIEVAQAETSELAGVPCLVVDATLRSGGALWHQRTYILGEGDRLYYLNLWGVKDRWAQDEAELEAIAQSFAIVE